MANNGVDSDRENEGIFGFFAVIIQHDTYVDTACFTAWSRGTLAEKMAISKATNLCHRCSTPVNSDNLVESIGHLRTFKCPECGTLIYTTVYPNEEVPIEKCSYEIRIHWEAHEITNNELFKLRGLLPELSNKPITDLKSQMGSRSYFSKIMKSAYFADKLIKAATEMGFKAEKLRR